MKGGKYGLHSRVKKSKKPSLTPGWGGDCCQTATLPTNSKLPSDSKSTARPMPSG